MRCLETPGRRPVRGRATYGRRRPIWRKLDRGAERIQPAIIALAELREAIEDGKPMYVHTL